jgi:hypothetical protein
MKRRYFLSMFFPVLFFFTSAFACIDPMDELSSGVIFNNNEGFFLSRFNTLGTEGINFFRKSMLIDPAPSIKDVQILTPTRDPINWHDMVSIKNVAVVNNLLQIDVSYGGGCGTHEFILYADSILMAGNPPILNFTLLHNANGDACKALITESLIFNLYPIEKIHRAAAPLKVRLNTMLQGMAWYPDNTWSIKYRSHFCSTAMVILEYTPMEKAASQVFPSLRIVTDPKVEFIRPFEYGKAVATELQWLANKNILSGVGEKTISRIEESMLKRQGQFWTLEDSLLAYNRFFPLAKDSTGEWKWGDALLTDKNGCSSTLEFALPADSLNSSTTSVKSKSGNSGCRNFTVKATKTTVTINFLKNIASPMHICIMNLNGRLLSRMTVPANQNSFEMQMPRNLGRGMYQMVLRTKGISQTKPLIISE